MNKLNHHFQRLWLILSLMLSLLLFLSACDSDKATPTAAGIAAAPSDTPAPPTDTPVLPTDTPAPPTPTAVPTGTPTPTPTPEPPEPLFETAACQFDIPSGRAVECGWLTVPEDRTQPGNDKTIRLHVAIFKSDSDNPAPDPIVYLEGGPGGDALEAVPLVFEKRFAPFLAGRDFIMFDQRGTGYSQPSLACPEFVELMLDTLEQDLSAEDEVDLTLETMSACHDRLVAEGVNLAAYNSAQNAADLNDLRIALGYEEWNLFGVSYGTRLAQTVMRDHPQGIRSVILDSTYPLAASLVTDTPANMDRAFALFFAGCAADPACDEAYPDLETLFYDLVDDLNADPAAVPVTYMFTGDSYDAVIDGVDMIGILFQSLYSAEVIPALPQLILDTSNGEYNDLGALMSSFLLNSEFISIGMQYSVQCYEEISFSQPGDAAAAAAAYPELEEFFTISSETDFLVCADWGAGTAGPIENEPVNSDLPTLILAGEYDPITPPVWGLMVAAGLSAHYYFEFPGIGHGASLSGDCPLAITLAFLDDPATEPDSSCLAEMGGPAFTTPGTAATETITLVPFTADLGIAQVEGVVPEGWEEASPGLFARGETALDQTFILQQAAPGVSADQLLSLLAGQLGLEETPQSVGVYEAANRAWTLYQSEMLGMPLDMALAEEGGYTYIVLLVSPAGDREFLYAAVFLPALEAINVP